MPEPLVVGRSTHETRRRWLGCCGALAVVVLLSCWPVFAASASAAGLSFAAPSDLSAAGHSADEPQMAIDASGDALAVWRGSDGSNDIVQGAFRPAGGAFAVPVNLSAAGRNGEEPQVAFDGSGDAVAVWHRSDGSNDIVQGAFRPAGGSFGAPVDLSLAGRNADQPQAAFDPSGKALVVWRGSDGTNNIVQGAFRPAGGPFAAPVDLSAAGGSASFPQVTFDASGNALAVWRRPAPTSPTATPKRRSRRSRR